MAIQTYPKGKERCLIGVAKMDPTISSVWKVILLREGGAFNPSHLTVADVVSGGFEMSGGSYARQSLVSMSLTISGTYVIWTSNSVTFTALPVGHTVVAAVLIYFGAGPDSSAYPVSFYDGGSYPNDLPKDTSGGDLVVTPHATDGWIKA
mgnify:CR=1 FL=1